MYLLSVRAGAELERERIAAELRESEERWLELARGTSDGLFDIDFGTGATYLSPRCLQLLGHEPQESMLTRVPAFPDACIRTTAASSTPS